ncbi:hypothetical protein KAR91_21505 [Candidatus Pacearchaeota archaeon]|nr:hypothetical protein [Candidatus Pacearchaeota archaeon]
MKELEKEIAELLLKEIKEAKKDPEIPGQSSPRERAVSCYREFIQAAGIRANIN